MTFLAFWGKARPHGAVLAHPVAYHSLDVAACARVLLDALPLVRSRLCAMLGDDAPALIVALIALHDVGKFSRPFQAFVPSLYPADLGPIPNDHEPRHVGFGYGAIVSLTSYQTLCRMA